MSSEMIFKRLVQIEKNKNIFKRMIKSKIALLQNQDNFQNKMVSTPPPLVSTPPSSLCAGGPGWGILRAIMVEKTIES